MFLTFSFFVYGMNEKAMKYFTRPDISQIKDFKNCRLTFQNHIKSGNSVVLKYWNVWSGSVLLFGREFNHFQPYRTFRYIPISWVDVSELNKFRRLRLWFAESSVGNEGKLPTTFLTGRRRRTLSRWKRTWTKHKKEERKKPSCLSLLLFFFLILRRQTQTRRGTKKCSPRLCLLNLTRINSQKISQSIDRLY